MKYTRIFESEKGNDIKKTVWHYDTEISKNPIRIDVTYAKTPKEMNKELKETKAQKRIERQMKKIDTKKKTRKTKKK
jgi:hypothetical protein